MSTSPCTNLPRSVLPIGYSCLPPGHVAAVVTFLEMRQRPDQPIAPQFPPGFGLQPLGRSALARYRALYRAVGEDWLWFSRIVMPDEELRSIIEDPQNHIFALQHGTQDVGILELDFRTSGACELAFFGVTKNLIGKGLGRTMMREAIQRAWSKNIDRLWLHTCTFDHPAALDFYKRSGFVPYAFQVEVQIDPRLSGAIPREAAPHIPLIDQQNRRMRSCE